MFAFPSMGFALFPVLISDAVEGGEVAIAAAAGAITAWGGLGAKPIVGRLGGRVALPIGMACGTLGYVIGTIAFATDHWPLVLVAAPLLGVASGVITMSCLALAGAMATNEQRGSLTSTVYLLGYPGMAMPLIVTSIASALTISMALVMVTTVAFVATVFVFFTGMRSGALAVGHVAE
jgi:MFS family permease